MPVILSSSCLDNLSFSNCGNYLHGFVADSLKRELVVIDVSQHIQEYHRNLLGYNVEDCDSDVTILSSTSNSLQMISRLASGTPPSKQPPGSIVFSQTDQGLAQVTQLNQYYKNGAIVLTTMDITGETKLEVLARAPKDLLFREAILVPPPLDSSEESVRLVIQETVKEYHCFHESDDVKHPMVFERVKSSVPTYSGRNNSQIKSLMDSNDEISSSLWHHPQASAKNTADDQFSYGLAQPGPKAQRKIDSAWKGWIFA
jgi:hypothetical protein